MCDLRVITLTYIQKRKKEEEERNNKWLNL